VRDRADIEILADQREMAANGVRDQQRVVPAVIPLGHVTPFEAPGLVERIEEAAQDQLIVVGKPLAGLVSQQFLDHFGTADAFGLANKAA